MKQHVPVDRFVYTLLNLFWPLPDDGVVPLCSRMQQERLKLVANNETQTTCNVQYT